MGVMALWKGCPKIQSPAGCAGAALRCAAAAGAVCAAGALSSASRRMESNRSRMPPWPGSSVP